MESRQYQQVGLVCRRYLLAWAHFNNLLVILAFVVCGGLLLELLRIVPELWSTVASMFTRITG